jgi:integral membrane protein (TIGR01906 family)
MARWIFILCIPILLLSATLAWTFNSLSIYKAGFAKYEVGQALGLSPIELDKSARDLIAYFNNPRQELLDINVTYDTGETAPLYDQFDILHMKDVKGVLWLDYRLFLAAAIYSAIYILLSLILNGRHGRRDLAMGAKWGGGATVALLIFLGVFAVTSFDWFFTTFHEIFFPNGNWQFPPGDHMITLFPDGFWSDVTLLVGLVTLGLALVVGGVGLVCLRRIKKLERVPAEP